MFFFINSDIKDYQFRENNEIKSIVCNKNVKNIGHSAFAFCSNMQYADLSNSNILQFRYAEFRSDSMLEIILLPPGLKKIGVESFCRCSAIKNIYIPDSVTIIEQRAFRWCSNLESIHLPLNLKVIKRDAFFCCSALEEIYIPSSVQTIEQYAFRSCINLEKVSISKKLLNNRGLGIFANCPNINTIQVREV